MNKLHLLFVALFLFLMQACQNETPQETATVELKDTVIENQEQPVVDTQTELLKVYNTMCDAASKGDVTVFSSCLSKESLNTLTKGLESAGKNMTTELLKGYDTRKEIEKLTFKQAIEQENAAGLLYFQGETTDKKTAMVNYLFLKFIKEDGAWKYVTTCAVSKPKYAADSVEYVFNVADLSAECKF